MLLAACTPSTGAAAAPAAAALLALAAMVREVAAHAHSYSQNGHDAWGAARAKVLPPGKPLAVFARVASLLQVRPLLLYRAGSVVHIERACSSMSLG